MDTKFINSEAAFWNFHIEIPKYYQNDAQLSSKNKPKFSSVYSRHDLPNIKDGSYVINLDEYKSIGTH